jgi:hypothetical protein
MVVAGREHMTNLERSTPTNESRDGNGAADHDQPYQFGRRSTSVWPHPFSGVEFARLLIMRGRVRAAREHLNPPHSSSEDDGLAREPRER